MTRKSLRGIPVPRGSNLRLQIGDNVDISPRAEINVTERLEIGDDSRISAGCVIEGRDVHLGRGFWMLPGAVIGGGSAFEAPSSLWAGDFLHMGRNTLINTARAVKIGNEVGLGTGTSLFTHGAYLSILEGFPVTFAPIKIGNRVWLPGAVVNPGVTIGSDVVVGVGSVVTKDIPSGALAMGIPARVVRENAYPAEVSYPEVWEVFFADWMVIGETMDDIGFEDEARTTVRIGVTVFDTKAQVILGPVTERAERLRDQLRRYGVRFYSRPEGGQYESWF